MFNMLGGNVDNFLSLGYFSGFNASLDSYYMCLEDLPRKIMWSTFFNPSYDFAKAIAKFKRILILFCAILVITSYLLFFELWSHEFDRLLHALMMSDLKGGIDNVMEWMMLHVPWLLRGCIA